MRKILFRGKGNKRYNEGSWFYGVPIQHYDGDWQICTNNTKTTVLKNTIGQYTGLTDKNGTEIFEGDIIQYVFPDENAKPDIGVVKFTEYEKTINSYFPCGFIVTWINDRYLRADIAYWTCYQENKIEVIGNIHDNPELLKEEDVEEAEKALEENEK